MIKKSVVTHLLVLVLSVFFATAWAQTEIESASTEEVQVADGNLAETECVPQSQIDLMSDDNVEKLELPICDEGEAATESNDTTPENDVTETENEVKTTENEAMTAEKDVAVEESTFPNANETLYEDQKSSD